jgi:hypothetical protein
MKSSRNIPGLLVANKAKQKAGAKTGRYDSLKGANEDRYQSFADAGWSRPDAGGSGPDGRKRMDFVPPKMNEVPEMKMRSLQIGPDSEALEESAMDEASDLQMLADEGRIKKGAIDERFMKEFARKGEKHTPGLLDQYKIGFSDLKEQFTSPEEITGIQEITNPAFREQIGYSPMMNEGSLGEAEGRLAADAYQQIPMSQSYLNQLGPKVDTEESALDKIGEQEKINRFAQEKRDRFQDSMPEQEEQSMLSKFGDSVSNFFGDDDEEKAKNYKAMASAYKGANTPSPQQGGNTSMQNARTVAGKVAFPGLLNKPKRQKTPYFMPKGLV